MTEALSQTIRGTVGRNDNRNTSLNHCYIISGIARSDLQHAQGEHDKEKEETRLVQYWH